MKSQPSTLVITNGDSATSLLKAAGKDAELLPWRDVLHVGAVPMTATLEEQSAIRASALEQAGLAAGPGLRAGIAERDALVGAHDRFDRIELWFEHDLYDQLQLMQILDYFAGQDLPQGKLVLVQADTYLTDYTPEEVLGLEEMARLVTAPDLEICGTMWTAFRQTTPELLAAQLDGPATPLPYVYPAIQRMLEELPASRTGLSRTGRQMLVGIGPTARTRQASCFPPPPLTTIRSFMGDHPFWRILEDLGLADEPLISGLTERFNIDWDQPGMKGYFSTPLALTAFGRGCARRPGRSRRRQPHRHVAWRHPRDQRQPVALGSGHPKPQVSRIIILHTLRPACSQATIAYARIEGWAARRGDKTTRAVMERGEIQR